MEGERVRDLVSGELDPVMLQRRREAGWRIAAVEWERAGAESAGTRGFFEVPFGYRVAPDCCHLQADDTEADVLRTILRGVVNDKPLSTIATELNSRGWLTRSGHPWNPASVFRLLPAVVDQGPRIMANPDWPGFRDA